MGSKSEESRDAKFAKIKEKYKEFESSLRSKGKGLVYRTEKGIYGTTNLDAIYKFFKEIKLENYNSLIDLGCGDGRVVLVAALFTHAEGVEYDKELLEEGSRIAEALEISCELRAGDYMQEDLHKHEIIFMNPDHEFGRLGYKLKEEMEGVLFIYNEIFAPDTLIKGRKFWPSQIPIVSYINEKK